MLQPVVAGYNRSNHTGLFRPVSTKERLVATAISIKYRPSFNGQLQSNFLQCLSMLICSLSYLYSILICSLLYFVFYSNLQCMVFCSIFYSNLQFMVFCIVFDFVLQSYFIVCVERVSNSRAYAITYLWLVIDSYHYTSRSYIYNKPQVTMMSIYSTHDNKYYIELQKRTIESTRAVANALLPLLYPCHPCHHDMEGLIFLHLHCRPL